MNILIIGTTDKLGGAAKVSWELKTSLEKNGHTVSMFVADKISDDPNVHTIPRKLWQKYLGYFLATDYLVSSDWILKTKEFEEADIVHCHNLHGRFFNLRTLQKMSLLKPTVWTLHDEWAITPHCAYTLEGTDLKNGLYMCPSKQTEPRILWNNTKHLADQKNTLYANSKLHIVSPSTWLLEKVRNTRLGDQDVQLIPNGIDARMFKKTDQAAARDALRLPHDKKIVLSLATAGKANTWKGWTYAEEIVERNNNKNVLFLNVGNFTHESSQKNILYRQHISDPAEIALYYSAADTLLFTSIAENFPLVILEAMSCGLPIVSFDVGGVKEVVTHLENGYIARYKNVDELQQGLEWALSLTHNEKEALAMRSVNKIKGGYTLTHMSSKYLDLYNKLLS
ncbi:hypothetical protein COB80_00950 [Candidatus Kaiserbacteria bacterium]|nr:MAG: hypothetical protein COB80_00950 [Candidatus Kaiserbacteria bacterium]